MHYITSAQVQNRLEFEELKPFPCNGIIIYAVRIVASIDDKK